MPDALFTNAPLTTSCKGAATPTFKVPLLVKLLTPKRALPIVLAAFSDMVPLLIRFVTSPVDNEPVNVPPVSLVIPTVPPVAV
jgi:hypothetical protein